MLQTLPDYLDNNPHNVVGAIEMAATGFYQMANDDVLAAGRAIAGGLAVIGIVQRGATYALGGRVDASGLMKYLLSAALVIGILEFWGTPMPVIAMTPPEVVSGMGRWLVTQTMGTALDDVIDRIHAIWNLLWSGDTSWTGRIWTALGGIVSGGMLAAVGALLGWGPLIVAVLLVLGSAAAALAQIVWAGIAIGICVMLGPVLVPWLLFQPLAFLFWGWLRTLLIYSLYGAIAVAVLRIFIDAALTQLEQVITSADFSQGAMQVLASLGTTLMLALTSVLAVVKIPALANGLVTGGGAAGSGVAEAATQAAAGSAALGTAAASQVGAGRLAGMAGGMAGAQPSIVGGAPIGVGGSRFASGMAGAAAHGMAAAGQVLRGSAVVGHQLPVTKRRR